ncbi:MAG TPA: hypothetical protein DCX14_06525 [Flavobacteriales bacterium]|jgi:outer membrane protein|nr:OmpH family outer membrane protein [Flavobacteriales bacterium]HAW19820.1 hypothetical protein [Flavobacteriales bacterium]
MRYLSIIALITLFSVSSAYAQSKMKFGHINSQELLEAMPEKAEADKALEDFAMQLEKQLQAMSSEYENKIRDYEANSAVMSDIIRQTKEGEIQDLGQRIQSFQQNAQQSLGKKEAEVYQPILDKAKEGIEAVSKEGGYAYVFDSSAGTLLYQPEGDNIIDLVKKKLGITGPPPAPTE